MALISKEKHNVGLSEHEWSPEEEIQLFYALTDLKPVGVNRHFYMACITERLSRALNRDITAEHVWTHLKSLYNLDKLNLQEPLPFPNEEKEFSLPEVEFSALLSKKRALREEIRQNSCDGPPSIIAVVTDNTSREKSQSYSFNKFSNKELDRKMSVKLTDVPKRTPKRTRGSMSLESSSPSTTPPPIQNNKRRRI